MTDFRPTIRTNLCGYQSIVEAPEHIEALNDILNDLDTSGFTNLEQKFSTQHDPDKDEDILFEILVCQMLRRNQDVQTLQYEPPDVTSPPDFRFFLHSVNFDLQVKRLHQTKNEIIKRRFVRECRK